MENQRKKEEQENYRRNKDMEEKLKEKDEELKFWFSRVPKSLIDKELSLEYTLAKIFFFLPYLQFRKSNKFVEKQTRDEFDLKVLGIFR